MNIRNIVAFYSRLKTSAAPRLKWRKAKRFDRDVFHADLDGGKRLEVVQSKKGGWIWFHLENQGNIITQSEKELKDADAAKRAAEEAVYK
jgi:hypothetical protein